MSTENLEELKARVNRLKGLLDDPHPGLGTWAMAYGKAMQAISDFWNCDAPEPDTERLDWFAEYGTSVATTVTGSSEGVTCSVDLKWWRGRERIATAKGSTLPEALRAAIDIAMKDEL